MTGKYLVKNRGWVLYLRASDAVLQVLSSLGPRREMQAASPRRALLAVGGHIGDAVIATAALHLLKQQNPELDIGVVAGSWAAPVFERHPDVSRLHVVDHWKVDRSARPLGAKLLQHRRSVSAALREVRAARYDVGIDLYAYYPNMAWLLWRAGIPMRVGYRSGGYGALYTHAVDWSNTSDHTAVQHARLLNVAFPSVDPERATRYALAPVAADSAERVDGLLQESGVPLTDYVVAHMGVGSRKREWPREKWSEVLRALIAMGHHVVLTGAGAEQTREADDMARECGCVSLAGRLRWGEFVHVITRARAIIAPETVAGHVAAAVGTPCVSLYTATGNITHWRPLSGTCSVLTHSVPCAPCYQRRGCDTMDCIRGIGVDEVLDATRAMTAEPARDLGRNGNRRGVG
jgi:ADP-heptose:LPS heptosyltransferase